jgi:hypothetical protein
MNEDLLRTLMSDVDPTRGLSDETLDELVPHERLMARVQAAIQEPSTRPERERVSLWRRVSFRMSAAAVAVVLVGSAAAALLDSPPPVLPSGLALGAVHSTWVRYDASLADLATTNASYTTSAKSSSTPLVSHGRITARLNLDGLTIAPPSANVHPRVSARQMEPLLWATTALKGTSPVAFGYADITLNVSNTETPKLHDVPVWVAIATRQPCKAKTCDVSQLVSSQLTVVVSGYGLPNTQANTGTPIAFVYQGAGKLSTTKPTLLPAIEQASVPWVQDGPVKNHRLYVTTGPFPCGALHGYSLLMRPNGATLTVESFTPESTIGDYCASSTVVHKVIPLTTTSNGVTRWLVNPSLRFVHAPTGPIRATK